MRRGRKRGAQEQAIGRSRGGRTTKIHAIVDGDGRIIAFELTGGKSLKANIALVENNARVAAQIAVALAAISSPPKVLRA